VLREVCTLEESRVSGRGLFCIEWPATEVAGQYGESCVWTDFFGVPWSKSGRVRYLPVAPSLWSARDVYERIDHKPSRTKTVPRLLASRKGPLEKRILLGSNVFIALRRNRGKVGDSLPSPYSRRAEVRACQDVVE